MTLFLRSVGISVWSKRWQRSKHSLLLELRSGTSISLMAEQSKQSRCNVRWITAQTALQPGLCKAILSCSHHWERAAGFLCQFPLLWVKQTALPEPAQRLVSEQPSWKCLLSSAAMYVFHLPAAWTLSVTKSCSMRKHHIYWADNPCVLTNLSSFHNSVALLLFLTIPLASGINNPKRR